MNAISGDRPSGPATDKSEAIRAALRQLWKVLVFLPPIVALMFLLAGRVDWLMGWVFVGVFFVGAPLVSGLVLVPRHPELVLERMRKHKPVKAWDKVLYPFLSLFGLIPILILPPLDVRFGWSPPLPLWVPLGALAVAVLAYVWIVWAMSSNKFFSRIVYVQTDRGHTVATGGPYRFVRHPGYTGMIVLMLATPVILGSLWSLIPAGIEVALVLVRTVFEDRCLHNELDGYQAYAERVRYRILPGVW